MPALADTAASPTPLAEYLPELREFFATHRISFGSPDDVVPFTTALVTPGVFHDEMSSVIRSIILREGGNVPRAKLLELVMVAVAGPAIEEVSDQYLPSIQSTVQFLGEVHRTRWGIIPAELTEAEMAARVPASSANATEQPWQAPGEFAATPATAPDVAEPLPPRVRPEIFFRSQVMSENQATDIGDDRPDSPPQLAPAATVPPVPAQAMVVAVSLAAEPATAPLLVPAASLQNPPVAGLSAPRSSAQPSRRRIWMSVAASLLLIAAVAVPILYQRRDEAHNLTIRQLPTPDPATSPATLRPSPVKPSPDGYALVRGRRAVGARVLPPASPRANRVPETVVESAHSAASGSAQLEEPTPAPPPAAQSPSPAPIFRMSPAPEEASVTPARNSLPPGTRPASPYSLGPTDRRTGPITVSPAVMAANLVSSPAPHYPELAKLTRTEGKVVLEAVVSPSGEVVATHVLDGHRLLRGAAEKAVRRWRFRPYIRNGRAREVATVIAVEFNRNK